MISELAGTAPAKTPEGIFTESDGFGRTTVKGTISGAGWRSTAVGAGGRVLGVAAAGRLPRWPGRGNDVSPAGSGQATEEVCMGTGRRGYGFRAAAGSGARADALPPGRAGELGRARSNPHPFRTVAWLSTRPGATGVSG